MKAQLQHILEDYPGGQLLSEALQNAEDSGATEFGLLLDLRNHPQEDAAITGPAFVLFDDGSGFGGREWKSLQNLHVSEKRNSPREIGQYGMGSRSYFHYSDVSMVVSRGKYVGIDPLQIVQSEGREGGGWELDLGSTAGTPVNTEAQRLFALPPHVSSAFDMLERGAMFRLPLRRAEDVAREESTDLGVLGPEISTARADELLSDWAESASRLLLFLQSVTRVAIWRWAEGAVEPECIAKVDKRYLHGGPFPRLPVALPLDVTESYRTLRAYIQQMSTEAREQMSEAATAVFEISTSGGGAGNASWSDGDIVRGGNASGSGSDVGCVHEIWMVVQRFDLVTTELLEAIEQGCEAVPSLGIAVPLHAAEDQHKGVPYCALPIGALRTNLPIHINGSFAPTPNRRELWLPNADLDGKHARMASWNG